MRKMIPDSNNIVACLEALGLDDFMIDYERGRVLICLSSRTNRLRKRNHRLTVCRNRPYPRFNTRKKEQGKCLKSSKKIKHPPR